MTAIDLMTVVVCSVAIGASVASMATFLFLGALRRRTIIREAPGAAVPEETESVLGRLSEAFHDNIPDGDREVLKALVVRYSETPLTSVLSDGAERSYLFEALGDPSRLPWKPEEPQREAPVGAATP